MAEISGFHNSVNGDRRVKADFFARFLASFIGNGVYPNPSTNLQVIANGDMTVTVKAGKAWVNGVFYENTADKVITLDVADGVLKRIDRIVVSDITLERDTYSKVKKGSFASTPAAPALQRDADAYELGIADIYVGHGATSISQANITDLRLNSAYCGIVHGLIDQVDGETLFIQFQAIFDDFMESLEGVLDENVAGNLLNLINDLVSKTGTLTGLTTTEKSNLVGAINELVTGIADIESDLSVHTTAISNNAQDIAETNQSLTNLNDEVFDHKELKGSASAIGHVKSKFIDPDGTFFMEQGRYQAAFGWGNYTLGYTDPTASIGLTGDEVKLISETERHVPVADGDTSGASQYALYANGTSKVVSQKFLAQWFVDHKVSFIKDIFIAGNMYQYTTSVCTIYDLTTASVLATKSIYNIGSHYFLFDVPVAIPAGHDIDIRITNTSSDTYFYYFNAVDYSPNTNYRVSTDSGATFTEYSGNDLIMTMNVIDYHLTGDVTRVVSANAKLLGNVKWNQSTPANTSISCEARAITDVDEVFSSGDNSTHVKENLLVDDSTYWVSSTTNTGSITYSFKNRLKINELNIKGYAKSSSPKNWTFQASNDGSNWTTLFTKMNDTWDDAGLNHTYSITNSGYYKYYKINITAVTTSGGNIYLLYVKMNQITDVLKTGIVSHSDLADIDPVNNKSFKLKWTLSRNSKTDGLPAVGNFSITWEGDGHRNATGVYSDTSTVIPITGTYIKKIPLGFEAKKGRIFIRGSSSYTVTAYFNTDPNKSFCLISLGNSVTSGNGSNLASNYNVVGTYITIKKVYISGENLVLELYNNSGSNASTVNLNSYWEVEE